MKRKVLYLIALVALIFQIAAAQTIEKIAPGVWKVSYGTPEKFRPSEFKEAPALEALQVLGEN